MRDVGTMGGKPSTVRPKSDPTPMLPIGDARGTAGRSIFGFSLFKSGGLGHPELFMALCAAIWLMNSWMSLESGLPSFRSGLWVSLLSVPVWAAVGVACSLPVLFILRLGEVSFAMSTWHRFNVGLALGLVLKPLLGITV